MAEQSPGGAGTVAQRRLVVDVVSLVRPATAALAARVAEAKSQHPLDPVTVVVPSNLAGLSARRLLGSGALGGTGLAGVDLVTPFRLAELLAAGRLGARRPLTTPVLAAAVRAALAAAPGSLARVARHEATQAALVATYAELSRAHPATLEAIAARSRRGADVVRLVHDVRRRLANHVDEDEVARAATARLLADPAVVERLGAVVWHLPERQAPAVGELLAQVLALTPAAVVVGRTGDADADAEVLAACAEAGIELVPPSAPLQLDLLAPPPPPLPAVPTVDPPGATRLRSAADPDDEVRAAVREVVALAEAGTPIDRIAIVHPPVEPYARTIHEQLAAAGVPRNGPAPARLADTVAGRVLRAVLDLPEAGWGRGDVLALVTLGPIHHDGHPAPAGRWDEVSRRAGVVGGLDDWRRKLGALAAEQRAEGAARARRARGLDDRRLDDRGPDGLPDDAPIPDEGAAAAAARSYGRADDADGLLMFLEELAGAVADVLERGTWAERSAAARALLLSLLGPESRRVRWPDHEVAAAGRVDAALTRLAALDEIEPAPSASTLRLAVAAELDVPAGRVGRFGEGVLVVPLAAAVGLDLDAVLVVGAAEGALPVVGGAGVGALLPEVDRELAVAGELATRARRLARQHRAYLAALAAAPHAVVSYPRGDLRGRRARQPSRWLLRTAADLAGRPVPGSELDGLDPSVLEVVASYADGVRRAVSPADGVDHDLHALLARADAGADPLAHPLVAGDLARGVAALRARAGSAFTEWDGNVAGRLVPSPATGQPISPSRLERWAGCGFRYFLSSVLRLDERDDPERIDDISGRDRGSLVHGVLERFVGEALAADDLPAPDEPWPPARRARLLELAEEQFAWWEGQGRVGRPLSWERRKAEIRRDLQVLLARDDEFRRRDRTRPLGVEVAFGFADQPPLELPLPDGRVIPFRGFIDRVDRADDGSLVVLDYKTGKDAYSKALPDDPVRGGASLQLGVYAEAARARFGASGVHAAYWLTNWDDGAVRPGYAWDEGTRARFLDVVGAVVDGIEGGTFPARPGEYDPFWGRHANCGFCPFDRICPRDRDDHERAKADAPELRILRRLEPPAPPEPSEPGPRRPADPGAAA